MLGWNNNDCILAIAPYAWSKGTGRTDILNGGFPSYPKDRYPLTIAEMDAGFGYSARINSITFEGGLFGNQGYVDTQYGFSLTNDSSFTIEAKLQHYAFLGQTIFSQYEDATNYIECIIDGNNRPAMNIDVAGTTESAIAGAGNEIANAETVTIHWVKEGALLSLFLNGEVVTSYATRDTYDRGNKAFANTARSGVTNTATNPFVGLLFWLAVYDTALNSVTIRKHSRLPNDMYLRAWDEGSTMYLSKKSDRSSVSITI